jgi:23S rRNA (uracil1939-C5)-methyltransferase
MEERIVITIEKLASGGDGLAFLDGKAIFVPFVIPGEKAVCLITESSRDYSRAVPIDILKPHPSRVTPPCPLFGTCGGCNLQHIEYSAQLDFKQRAVRESFLHIAKFDPGILPIVSGASYGYRNRVQVHCTEDHGFGFMASESNRSMRAHGCPIAVKAIDTWLRQQNRKSRPDRELKARIGDKDRFVVFAQNNALSIEGMNRTTVAAIGPITYTFPLGHFFQSNLELTEKLIDAAIEGLSGERAADLYSGAGLFAARLADRFKEVILVESDTISLEAARTNMPKGRGRFYGIDVDAWVALEQSRIKKGIDEGFDWLVLDPPRSGLSTSTREWLKKAPIGGFSYVSCDHGTMARDLGELTRSGWQIDSLELYDFYPQTGRIEALAKASRPREGHRQGV